MTDHLIILPSWWPKIWFRLIDFRFQEPIE